VCKIYTCIEQPVTVASILHPFVRENEHLSIYGFITKIKDERYSMMQLFPLDAFGCGLGPGLRFGVSNP